MNKEAIARTAESVEIMGEYLKTVLKKTHTRAPAYESHSLKLCQRLFSLGW